MNLEDMESESTPQIEIMKSFGEYLRIIEELVLGHRTKLLEMGMNIDLVDQLCANLSAILVSKFFK